MVDFQDVFRPLNNSKNDRVHPIRYQLETLGEFTISYKGLNFIN